MKKKYQIASAAMIALTAASMAVPSVYAQTTSTVKNVTDKMAGLHRGPFDHAKMLEEQAEVLGITVDDLKARMDAGQTFQDIVKELGISEDAMKAKMEEHRAERLAEMKAKIAQEVTDGKITQAEADTKIANLENGKGPQGEGRGMGMMKDDSRMLEDKAAILGITVDDLKSRLDAGKCFEDIATDLGISADTLKAKMEEQRATRLAEMKAKIASDVAAGTITQEEADKMLERLTNPGKHGFGRGMGKEKSEVGSRKSGVESPKGFGGFHDRQNNSDSTSASQQ